MMFTDKNSLLKLLIPLLLSVFLVACGGTLSEAEYVNSAKTDLANGNAQSAVINLKNALKLNAANPDAHALLGKIMLDSDSPALAEVEFEKLKQFGADKNVWLPGLAKALLLQGKLDALMLIDESEVAADSSVKILAYKVMALVQRKKLAEAEQLVKQADAINSNVVDLRLAKIRLYSSADQFDKARGVIATVLQETPDQFDALLLLGDIELHHKNLEAAEGAYGKAHESSPDRSLAAIQLAKVKLMRGNKEGAQTLINGLLKKYPNHAATNMLQAKLLVGEGKRLEALPFVEKAANAGNAPLDAYYYAALIHLENNRIEQADQYAGQLFSKAPNSILAMLLKANIRLKQAALEEAITLSSKVIGVQPSNDVALNILATALMQSGDVNKAIGYFEQVAVLKPEVLNSHTRLASALLASKQYGEADKRIELALGLEADNAQALTLKVKSLIRQQREQDAQTIIEGLKRQYTAKAWPYLLEGELYKELDKQPLAKRALKEGCSIEPNEPNVCMAYAELLVDDKEYGEALSLYDSLIKSNDNNLNIVLAKAKLLALQDNMSGMEALLLKAVNDFPKSVQPKLILAQQYLSQGQASKSLSLLSTTDKAMLSNYAYIKMWASSLMSAGQFKKANVAINKALSMRQDDKQALIMNALIQSNLGNPTFAESQLVALLKETPDSEPLILALAKVQYQQKNYQQAEATLTRLDSASNDKVNVLQLRSTLALAKGELRKARLLAEQAFEKQPSTPNLLMLSQQYWREGQHDKALEKMQAWLKKSPDDLRVRMELGNLYMQTKDNKGAINEFGEILKRDKTNIVALNNLAWLLTDSDPQQAVELASRLNDIQPGVPAFLDTLATAQLSNGNVELASRYIEQAIAKQSTPTYIYHKAMIDAKKGDWLVAIKNLTSLLEKDDAFAERKDAEAFLDMLKEGG